MEHLENQNITHAKIQNKSKQMLMKSHVLGCLIRRTRLEIIQR